MGTGVRVRRAAAARPRVPRAKIATPRLPPSFLPRPRLLAALDGVRDDQLVLLSAPAGYGKTLLLAEWATAAPDRTAWVSLDGDDNDDRRFWAAVLAATAASAARPTAERLHGLALPEQPSRDPAFLAEVSDALELTGPPLRLVLDDVHELTAPAPLHGLAALVRHPPAGLQLVLAGRSDPPLHLPRLRPAGRLCELRADDLAFSMPEAAALLTGAQVSARDDQVRLLVEQTGGWPAGLRLAALSIRERGDADRFLADFLVDDLAVSDYLVSEIMSRMRPELRAVLQAASVCTELSAPLAVVLCRRPDAGDLLDVLERETSLLVSYGEGRRWYRVHPLLRAHLLAELRRRSPAELDALHRRAAAWFVEHRMPVPALTHARHAGDDTLLARLVQDQAPALIAAGQDEALQAATEHLGDARAAQEPWLALVVALVHLEAAEPAAAERLLAVVADSWPDRPPEDLVALDTLVRCRRAELRGELADLDRLGRKLAARRIGDPALAALARFARARAALYAGRGEEAAALASAALGTAAGRTPSHLAARCLQVLAAVAALDGDHRRMRELVARTAERAGGGAPTLTALTRAYGLLLDAAPARCLEELPAATADPGEEPMAGSAVLTGAVRGAALCDRGDRAAGLDLLHEARSLAARIPGPVAPRVLVAVLEHEAALAAGRAGHAQAVVAWIETVAPSAGEVLLLRARGLRELGRDAEAAAQLGPLLDGSAEPVLPWVVADAWVLDCHLALRAGNRSPARRALEQALAESDRMDVLRPLAAGPAAVHELLSGLAGGLGRFDHLVGRVLAGRARLGAGSSPIGLTVRERAVLGLLPTLRSVEEMAADLDVSPNTVKTHLRAVYTKLGVGSRRGAVVAGRRHGLLPVDGPAPARRRASSVRHLVHRDDLQAQ